MERQTTVPEAPLTRSQVPISEAELDKEGLSAELGQDVCVVGRLLAERGRYAEAEVMLRVGIELEEARASHPAKRINSMRAVLAFLLVDMGRHAEAEPVLRRIIDDEVERVGPASPRLDDLRFELAGCLLDLGVFDESEQLFRELLQQRRVLNAQSGSDVYDEAECLRHIALALSYGAKLDEAEDLVRQARQMGGLWPSMDQAELEAMVADMDLIGWIRWERGSLGDAQGVFQRALELLEGAAERFDASYATALASQGCVLLALGQPSEARKVFERSVGVTERLGPIVSRNLPDRLNALAAAQLAEADTRGAEQGLRRALDLDMARLGADHIRVACRLSNLAMVRQAEGKGSEAKQLVQRAAAIVKRRACDDGVSLALVERNLKRRSPISESWLSAARPDGRLQLLLPSVVTALAAPKWFARVLSS